MTTALEGGEWSASRPGRSLPPGWTRYPLYRSLGGPQGRSGQVRKISPPPGFDPRPARIQSLYRLSYPTHHVWSYFAQFFSEWEILRTKAKKIKTRMLCVVTFVFRKLCRSWDNLENIVQPGRPQMTVWFFFFQWTLPVCVTFIICFDISSRTLQGVCCMWLEISIKIMTVWFMRIACWIPEATKTHSEYVILNAFALRKSLHIRAWLLRYTYIAYVVTRLNIMSNFYKHVVWVRFRFPLLLHIHWPLKQQNWAELLGCW